MPTQFSDKLVGYRQTTAALFYLLRNRQIDIRKTPNLAANLLACIRDKQPPYPPPVLQLDINNNCNLKCPGCLSALGLFNNREDRMPWPEFTSLIDSVQDETMLAVLYNSGEPFLHPDIFAMIQYLTNNKIASMVSTNGHFLTAQAEAERLVASGLSTLIFSLSGATQAVYEQYHRGGDLSTVIKSIREVLKARKKAGRRNPTVVLRFLLMDHNRHEIEAMKRLAGRLSCDACQFRAVNWQPHLLKEENWPSSGEASGHGIKADNRVCLWPWLISTIKWDGDVFPCCFYYFDLPLMGNAFESGGIRKVWYNDAYTKFRKKMRQGRRNLPVCSRCPAEIGFQTKFSRQRRTVYVKRHD